MNALNSLILDILEEAGPSGMHEATLMTRIMGTEWGKDRRMEICYAIGELRTEGRVWLFGGSIGVKENAQAKLALTS